MVELGLWWPQVGQFLGPLLISALGGLMTFLVMWMGQVGRLKMNDL